MLNLHKIIALNMLITDITFFQNKLNNKRDLGNLMKVRKTIFHTESTEANIILAKIDLFDAKFSSQFKYTSIF